DKQDAVVFPENILRTVAVMHIPIDDRDLAETMHLLGMPRRHGNVVVHTKAQAFVRRGMVAWRTDQSKCISNIPAKHCIDCRQCSTGRKPRDLFAARNDWCAVASIATGCADRLNPGSHLRG